MVQQVRTVWTGFSGAPGYTNLYFADGDSAEDCLNAVDQFWTDLDQVFPTGLTHSIDNGVQSIDTNTGVINGVSNGTTFHPPIAGGAINAYGPAPAGICISWHTPAFVAGHAVKGRTFLVPVAKTMFEDNGTLSTAALTDSNVAAVNLIGDTNTTFVVWHRPILGAGGTAALVNAATIRDKAAVLRSRRD